MPKPGDLRRRHIDLSSDDAAAPPPLVAWSIVTRTVEESNAGVLNIPPDEMHPCIVQVIALLGNAVYGLRNATDQHSFIKAYEQVVSDYQQQKYRIL